MKYHRLDASELSALASGLGGPATLQELISSRLSAHLLLLKFVCEHWVGDREDLASAVQTLAEAQATDAAVFTDLMSDPMVGAWLARTARSLRGMEPRAGDPSADLLQLGGLAAAAAIRLGLDCAVTSQARQGMVALPTAGEIVLAAEVRGPVQVTVLAGRVSLSDPAGRKLSGDSAVLRREPWWLKAQYAGVACSVRVEDAFPYRDCYHSPPAGRLTPEEVDRWQQMFAAAWELICRYMPHRATETATLLRTIVPLTGGGPGESRSCTSRDAVAAIGLSLPHSAADFAVTLIHELQHSKLTAAIEIVPLHSDDDAEWHFAPWKDEPRHTAGLFQGIYAFLGVADAWSSLRAAPELTQLATWQFATVREQVRVGLESLSRSTELTPAGAAFVEGMGTTLQRLLSEPLPGHLDRLARSSVNRRRTAWNLRHADRVGHAL